MTSASPGSSSLPEPSGPTEAPESPASEDLSLRPEERAYLEAVEETLASFLQEQRGLLAEISEETLPLVDALERLGRGGKRLRALFLHWGWRGAGGRPDAPEAVLAGVALELFQTAALVHDDILDHSETRRGQPSAHRGFRESHRAAGWAGSAEDYGRMGGIIAGDLCLAWSEAVFASIGTPEAASGRARRLFDRMRTEVMAGQFLDEHSEAVADAGAQDALDRARTVIRYKTATYSCERPLGIGAALAGGSDALVSALGGFGLPLGEAFQLRDDVLGVFGEPGTTGKPAGDDLREGKRTVLVALARAAADPQQLDALDRGLGREDLGAEETAVLAEIVRATGALEQVERMIDQTEEQARAALAGLPVDAATRQGLGLMASRALRRSA